MKAWSFARKATVSVVVLLLIGVVILFAMDLLYPSRTVAVTARSGRTYEIASESGPLKFFNTAEKRFLNLYEIFYAADSLTDMAKIDAAADDLLEIAKQQPGAVDFDGVVIMAQQCHRFSIFKKCDQYGTLFRRVPGGSGYERSRK